MKLIKLLNYKKELAKREYELEIERKRTNYECIRKMELDATYNNIVKRYDKALHRVCEILAQNFDGSVEEWVAWAINGDELNKDSTLQ